MDVINDLRMEPPAITSLGCSLTIAEEVNSSPKQKRARKDPSHEYKAVEHNNKGPDFSLNNSSQKTDDTIKDPSHEYPALPNLLSSQRSVEFNSEEKYKKRKRNLSEHNATEINVNSCDAPEDSFLSKTSTPALDMLSESNTHKFSDGPLMVGLLERETKLSRDEVTSHSGTAAKEMKLMTEGISEQRFMATSSVVDTPLVRHEETNDKPLDHTENTRNDPCYADVHSKISQFSPDKTNTYNTRKKLLILDVNGLLADFVSYVPQGYREPDFSVTWRNVYKRPFCDDFLKFCFDRFHVGVWSSRAKSNVDKVVEFLMGKSASKLLFSWNQSHCTMTDFSTVENRDKPLALKELRKLWEKVEPGLPWEKGEFNESNTLLLDDSPYKALVNPMYTAIFPYSYHYYDSTDSSLGPGGDLRVYLEGLAMAENVQEYVSSNPFGQRPIRETNPSWRYYRKVIEAVKCKQSGREQTAYQRMPDEGSSGRERTAYRRMQDEGSSSRERTAYRRMQDEGSPGRERTAYRRMHDEGSRDYFHSY